MLGVLVRTYSLPRLRANLGLSSVPIGSSPAYCKMAFHCATQRMLGFFVLAVVFLYVLIFALRGNSVTKLIYAIKNDEPLATEDEPSTITEEGSSAIEDEEPWANYNNSPAPAYGLGDILFDLYKPIKLPVTAKSYTDQLNSRFDTGQRNYWKEPLGKEIIVVDIDTRNPDGKNEIFNAKKIYWEGVEASGSGLLTVSYVNHFIYCESAAPFSNLAVQRSPRL